MQAVRRISEVVGWIAEAARGLSIRRDRAPLEDVDQLAEFCSTRAALVTQKKLYGYLKERMGISYPKMFEDEIFAKSINVAKMQIYAASLGDMCVFTVAHAASGSTLPEPSRVALAIHLFKEGINANAGPDVEAPTRQAWLDHFRERAFATNWANVAASGHAFVESPKALVRWAPIADEHKRYDREIVENSMRFAWNEVRQEFRERLNGPAIAQDWQQAPTA